MKNEENIKIEDLEKCYKPVVWSSFDKITNLSDETVGYYAYLLQEELNKKDSSALDFLTTEGNDGKLKNGVLVTKPLEKITAKMENTTITYKCDEWNRAKEQLDFIESNPTKKEKMKLEMGEHKFNAHISNLKELEKTPILLHQFELYFMVWRYGVGSPIVLRNGYLLKCLQEAEIKTFEEIDNYQATFIFNNATVNGHICSFVKFEKKNDVVTK